jgi:hypothetical protein
MTASGLLELLQRVDSGPRWETVVGQLRIFTDAAQTSRIRSGADPKRLVAQLLQTETATSAGAIAEVGHR